MEGKKKEGQLGEISRRSFIGSAAALGGVLGIGAVTASAATAPSLESPVTTFGQSAAGFNLPVKRVDEPTYTKDVVEKIERFDERDAVFNRARLVPGTDGRYEDYYKRRPEMEKHHPKVHLFYDKEYQFNKNKDDWTNRALGDAAFAGGSVLGLDEAVDGPVSPKQFKMDPAVAAEKIKGFCKALGADLVGIGPCKTEWLYTHVGGGAHYGEPITQTYKYAISIACPQQFDLVATGTDNAVGLVTGVNYAKMALITDTVAAYIRSMGYPARANHYRNYIALCVPLAVDGGLGELGRNGFLVTKEFGANTRLASILTDLPMTMDKPVDLGIQDFCSECKLCAEWCPSGSIPMGEKTNTRGINKWQLNANTCITYWSEHTGMNCSLCQVNCPWSKPPSWIHSMAVESASHSSLARRILPRAEKVVYGKWVNHEAPGWMTNSRK